MKIVETVQVHCAWLEQLRRRGVIEKPDELRLKMDAWEAAARAYAEYFTQPVMEPVDFDARAALSLAMDFLRLRTLLNPVGAKPGTVPFTPDAAQCEDYKGISFEDPQDLAEARDASGVSEASAGQ